MTLAPTSLWLAALYLVPGTGKPCSPAAPCVWPGYDCAGHDIFDGDTQWLVGRLAPEPDRR